MQQGGAQASTTSSHVATVHMMGGATMDSQIVEEASPISSRPPAGNLDELMHDEDGDRGGGAGGTSANRWPKQETLALLKIRSDMDAAFRDAPLKAPLWEDVSRKLAELGYKRNAKKCKEKFENVHKYYKRTKEGRAGRQDGKSYKFFTELEALHTTTTNVSASSLAMATAPPILNANPSSTNFVSLGVGINNTVPMPISCVHPTITFTPQTQVLPKPVYPPTQAAAGISFSSNSTSSMQGTEDDNDENGETGDVGCRKRKRTSMSNSSMMEFFESLMKQVMEKQEAMQQKFLEAIEKREHDRMVREEAWKRQEMARLTREHEIIAQERAIAGQRDAAIVSFIQNITGQTVQLSQHASVTAAPTSTPTPVQAAPLPQHQHQPQQHQKIEQKRHDQSRSSTEIVRQTSSRSTDVVMAVPEQQVPPKEASGGSYEPSSSRWPKEEIFALINLRSGLEPRYQEAVPKGPLWEEISAGMGRLGYKRSSKRCKEKWENINKYYKKVKESNRQRPEDAKTCPYFYQLDALYRQKVLGNTSSGVGNENRPQPQQHGFSLDTFPSATMPQDGSNTVQATQPSQAVELGNKNGSSSDVQTSNISLPGTLFGQETGGAAQKPEDIVKELMDKQLPQNHQLLTVDDYGKVDEHDHGHNLDQDEYEYDDEDEGLEDQRKIDYKIEIQRQSNGGPSNGEGNGAPSFLGMVQ